MHLPSGSGPVLHFLFESLGFFLGYWFYAFLRRRSTDPISDSNRLWILIGAIFGALIGSRLVGALEYPPALMQATHPLLFALQCKTIMGGLFGGLLGVEGIKKTIGEKHSSGDVMVFPLLLGIGLGRIGCLAMGINEPTYGLPTQSVFGMDLGDGTLRHPTALYEIVFLVFFAGLLGYLQKRFRMERGFLFKLFMLGYFGFRFALEFLKPRYPVLGTLGTIQLTCIALWLYYLPTFRKFWTAPQTLIYAQR
ncbi:MAG: diacylglyceryl transferase [Sphingobacteriales bacterium]|nr:MAG: diacylglyceryl transferase [Sphingobacteriales bacterium]